LYLKLPLEVPEAIVTEVIVAVSPVLRNRPPDELFVRFTVVFVEAVPGCPFVILNCTVIVPEVTPAVSVWALVVNASLVTGAAIAAGGEALKRMVAKRTAAGIVVIRRGKRLNTVKGLLSIGCTDRSHAGCQVRGTGASALGGRVHPTLILGPSILGDPALSSLRLEWCASP
jgi:hypothetical protein